MSLLNICPPKRTFEHNGQTYEIKTLDENVRAQYEEASYQAALKQLDKVAHLYSKETLQARKEALADDYCKRKFRLNSEDRLSLDQGLRLACLLFQCEEQEAITLMSECGDDIARALHISQKQALPEVAQGTDNGKKKA